MLDATCTAAAESPGSRTGSFELYGAAPGQQIFDRWGVGRAERWEGVGEGEDGLGRRGRREERGWRGRDGSRGNEERGKREWIREGERARRGGEKRDEGGGGGERREIRSHTALK